MTTSGVTDAEKLFLARWRSINFSGWNEAEVREGFIIDLLHTLGYRKGTSFDLELEKPLKLSEPFHRIGRKKVDIDYAPSVRKKYFWILEAKPGKSRDMDVGDLLQVHLYAVHPEMQARLVVLTNGWEVRVYDALTLKSFDDTLLTMVQASPDHVFAELRDVLGATQMRRFQRKRMLEVLRDTLASEVDMKAFEDLAAELQDIVRSGRKTVEENGRELWMTSMKQHFEEEARKFKEATLDALYVHMDNPGDGKPGSANEFVNRVLAADEKGRAELVDWLAMHYRGRPHNIFRVLALHALVSLAKSGVVVPDSQYAHGIIGSINELALSNMEYWGSGISNALCHLDNIAARVSMKLCVRVGSPHFQEILDLWKQSMTPEELASLAPGLEGLVANSANHLHGILWRWYCSEATSGVWNGIWDLQAIEAQLDKLPPKPEHGRLDFYGVQFLGLSWDQLRVGTWNVLKERPGLGDLVGIDSDVAAFSKLSRAEVISGVPAEQPRPRGFVPTKTMGDVMTALGAAIRLRAAATVGQQIAKGLK